MKNLYLFLAIVLLNITAATSQTLLNEGFEGAAFPPAGWTLLNGSRAGGHDWSQSTIDPHSGNYSMIYPFSSTASANAWMISPGLTLTAGVSYSVSFAYAVGDPTYPEKLKVTLGNAATIAAQTTVLWNNNGGTNLTDNSYRIALIKFTVPTSGNYYLGFNCYSDADEYYVTVDDVTVEQTAAATPSCVSTIAPANGSTGVNVYPLTFSWHPVASATSYDFYADIVNPPTYIGNITDTSISFAGIAYNSKIYWSVTPRNSAGATTGCPVLSFTTQSAPPAPANDECTTATVLGLAPVNGTTIGATRSGAAEICLGDSGIANDDVWYKFTAVNNGSAVIRLSNASSIFDGVLIAYAGTCGALTPIGCIDATGLGQNETLSLTNLVAGQSYYVRVYSYDEQGYEGAFTLTATGNALPITLSSFSGQRLATKSLLTWNTASEQNSKGFELQRSADGKTFSSIAFINSKAQGGSSSATLQYTFEDLKPFSANNYYRLKQLDLDGKGNLSNIVFLKGQKVSNLQLSAIYPNPATSVLKLVASAPINQKINLVVTDLAGKIVMQQSNEIVAGDNNLQINITELPSGSYMVKALCTNGCETAVSKFVKQ